MRHGSGFSMVELLVTVLVMAISSSAIFGMLITIMGQSHKLQNRCDTIEVARNGLEKVGRDMRGGRSLGDVFGTEVNNMVEGSDIFPSSRNPLYGAGQTPPNGWPVWSDFSKPESFRLSNTTLVVQVPVFDQNGWPSAIPQVQLPPGMQTQANVETHIYMVVPDPQFPGEWQLQWAKIPGAAVPGYDAANLRPSTSQTIATGIVGPLNPMTGQPRVFQYLDKLDGTGTPRDTIPDPQNMVNYSGVIINLEIRQHRDTSQVSGKFIKTSILALKSEIFLRNNSIATTVGMPSQAQSP